MGRRIPFQGLTAVLDEKGKLYWCNGEVKECPKSFCYKNGGGCFKTRKIENAASIEDVLNTEDRVRQYNYWNPKFPVVTKENTNKGKIILPNKGLYLPNTSQNTSPAVKDLIENSIRKKNEEK